MSFLGALTALCLLTGIRYPGVRMMPLLIFELAWKSLWLLAIWLPLALTHQYRSRRRRPIFFPILLGVILPVPFVLPCGVRLEQLRDGARRPLEPIGCYEALIDHRVGPVASHGLFLSFDFIVNWPPFGRAIRADGNPSDDPRAQTLAFRRDILRCGAIRSRQGFHDEVDRSRHEDQIEGGPDSIIPPRPRCLMSCGSRSRPARHTTASGKMPKMNASEVIKIGRKPRFGSFNHRLACGSIRLHGVPISRTPRLRIAFLLASTRPASRAQPARRYRSANRASESHQTLRAAQPARRAGITKGSHKFSYLRGEHEKDENDPEPRRRLRRDCRPRSDRAIDQTMPSSCPAATFSWRWRSWLRLLDRTSTPGRAAPSISIDRKRLKCVISLGTFSSEFAISPGERNEAGPRGSAHTSDRVRQDLDGSAGLLARRPGRCCSCSRNR